MPVTLGQLRTHLKSPPAKHVVCGEIMFNQLVAPGADAGDVVVNECEILRKGEVEWLFLGGAWPGAQAMRIINLRQGRGTHPNARADAKLFHAGGEAGHVGKAFLITRRPSAAGADRARRPTRVNDAIRAVGVAASNVSQESGGAQHRVRVQIAAIGVVPVVVAADWGGRKPGHRTKQAAETRPRS